MKLAVAIGFAMAFGNAYAFHEGGVAYCDGCHTMHASEAGTTMRRSTKSAITQFNAGPYLLQGTTQSGACLNCHEGKTTGGYYVSSTNVGATKWYVSGDPIPQQRGPGGDFSWLKYDYTWDSPRAGSERGSRHGHSIVAGDFGYTVETRLTGNVAPGGTYPVGILHCSSCHDPHGRYRESTAGTFSTSGQPIWASGSYGEEPDATYAIGAYRLLGGVGYKPMSVTVSGLEFVNGPPTAVAPGTYNRSEGIDNYTRVAYGSGMSEWCANCHPNIHNNSANIGTVKRHPTGANAKLAGTNSDGTAFDFAANYNAYVKTGDVTGVVGSSFLSLVQFEEGTTVGRAGLASHANIDGSYLNGPAGTANVTCMSCHRAHASGFQSMTRWENKSEFLTVDRGAGPEYADQFVHIDEGVEARGKDAAMYQAAMNGIAADKFSGWQRSLCNKCHLKD